MFQCYEQDLVIKMLSLLPILITNNLTFQGEMDQLNVLTHNMAISKTHQQLIGNFHQ